MELFTGLLQKINGKGLRQKYGSGQEGALLAYWLDGWPQKKPALPLEDGFFYQNTGATVFTGAFSRETCPQLLALAVCCVEELKRRGIDNYQLHLTTCAELWLPENKRGYTDNIERMAERLLEDLAFFRKFIAELCGEPAAAKVFVNVDGEYPREEDKSLCRLLISNL